MNIFITGANRGLGYSLTRYGLEQGHVMIAGTRAVNKELEQLKDQYGEKLVIVEVDVTSEKSVSTAAKWVSEVIHSVDVIINNAGILLEREKTIEEIDIEECMRSLDINTFGPMRIIKHFLPMLRKGEKQSILNISSEAGSLTNAYSGDYPYGLSKAALNMLSEKLHVYLEEEGIQVLSVHPGWMKTDMGGEQAPTDPLETAKGIFQLISRKQSLEISYVFVDYLGKAMDI